MKKFAFLLPALLLSFACLGQQGRTFKVEKLTPPESLLQQTATPRVWESLVDSEIARSKREYGKPAIDFQRNIIATSPAPDSLVRFGDNPFFNSMYRAYADHRPFVMSPDMIWLLISQGFARHVNNNAEALRHHFVDFEGKTDLMVVEEKYYDWEEIINKFAGRIGENTSGGIADLMTADFSTTTAVERVASQITLMESMKSYFDFTLIFMGCGIPEITLLGTTEDWEKVLDKTRELAKYDLEWWTSRIEPLLAEFVNASKGKVDKKFWMHMFRIHSVKEYGARDRIDGWIVKFYPYDNSGRRHNLEWLRDNKRGADGLPPEQVKVDMKLKVVDGTGKVTDESTLELWAGFIGADQNAKNFALTPRIGWMVRNKNELPEFNAKRLEALVKANIPIEKPGTPTSGISIPSTFSNPGIDIRVSQLPVEIYQIPVIYSLSVEFTGKIDIPDRLAQSEIHCLTLRGEIDQAGTDRIRKLFPDTELTINGKKL